MAGRHPGRPKTVSPQSVHDMEVGLGPYAHVSEDGQGARKSIFRFVCDYKARHDGISPSVREIAMYCHISSTSVVNYHILALKRQGAIRFQYNVARSIEVIGAHWLPPAEPRT